MEATRKRSAMNLFRQFYKLGGIGGIIGLIGGAIGAAVAIAASPVFGAIFTIIIFGVFWIVLSPILRGMAEAEALEASGETAEATVLKLWDTGLTVNEVNPQVGLLLEVRPANRPAYQVKTKMLISRLQVSEFQPGAVLTVKIDPNNQKRVTVVAVGGTAIAAGTGVGASMQPQLAEQMLRKIDAANEALIASGESAQATILQRTDMDIMVNGENPAVILMLEVHPTNRPPFQAEARGIIAAASNDKYQPGAVIWAKFDPNDTTRVAVHHS
jgi:hypothetical protein